MSSYDEEEIVLEPTPLEYYVQQVKDCCSCFECASDEQWEKAAQIALENWGLLTCGNWIDEHIITLRVPLETVCGGRCPRILIQNLPEEWVQPETIKVKAVRWLGLETTELELDAIFDEATHNLRIDVSNLQDCCDCCGEYEIVLKYVVGTDTIPPALCPWFCAIAKVYMQLEDMDCKSCGEMDDVAIVETDGTKDLSATIKYLAINYFQNVIDEYSLCLLKSLKDWTVVA